MLFEFKKHWEIKQPQTALHSTVLEQQFKYKVTKDLLTERTVFPSCRYLSSGRWLQASCDRFARDAVRILGSCSLSPSISLLTKYLWLISKLTLSMYWFASLRTRLRTWTHLPGHDSTEVSHKQNAEEYTKNWICYMAWMSVFCPTMNILYLIAPHMAVHTNWK